MVSINPNYGTLKVIDRFGDPYNTAYVQVKPILRLLSDLKNEIQINGEIFAPIDEINRYRNYQKVDIHIPLGDYPIEINIDTENYTHQIDLSEGYDIMQKLFEWHFDVFGLIESGLAIDISTLEL